MYTIQNNFKEDIVAGFAVLTPAQCVEFFDFPLIGDFPIKFRYKNHLLISDKTYPASHYIISKEGKIIQKNNACQIDKVGINPLGEEEQNDSVNQSNTTKPDESHKDTESSATQTDESHKDTESSATQTDESHKDTESSATQTDESHKDTESSATQTDESHKDTESGNPAPVEEETTPAIKWI